MNIITDEELSSGKRRAFAVGVVAATLSTALAWHYWPGSIEPAAAGAPPIVVQTLCFHGAHTDAVCRQARRLHRRHRPGRERLVNHLLGARHENKA
jgi:hypothetical protein